jgi:hypothetical protein
MNFLGHAGKQQNATQGNPYYNGAESKNTLTVKLKIFSGLWSKHLAAQKLQENDYC